MHRWYAVHTQVQGEAKAVHHLRRQGFDVYLPQYLKRRRHARRVDWMPSPLFPRYLFVNMDTEASRWRAINSTVGVSYLVSSDDCPSPVPDGVVEEIQARTDDSGMVSLVHNDLEKGTPVQVTSGAFCDLVGLFECADDNERIFILLELMGRQVKVRVSVEAVCAVF